MGKVKSFFKSVERFVARRKQQAIMHYLLHRAGGKDVVARHAGKPCAPAGETVTATSPVWTCWWQGEEAMPDIARACLEAMRRAAGSHPVVLVTEANYRDYVDMPDYIVQRQRAGEIDLTHFSDILRMMLLARHGGIWMDCTVLLPSRPLDAFIPPGTVFWSCRHHTPYLNVSRGGWVSFFVACGKGNLLASFIADFHLTYWKTHARLVDYLLLDYAFALARRCLPAVREMVERVPLSEMGPLGKCLNEAFDEGRWQEFCTRYNFHKLTYKIPLHTRTPEGKKTYYGHILDTYLPLRHDNEP